jgi:hypothetical protein
VDISNVKGCGGTAWRHKHERVDYTTCTAGASSSQLPQTVKALWSCAVPAMASRNPSNSKTSSNAEKRASVPNSYASSTRPRVASAGGMDGENERRKSTTSHTRKETTAAAGGERRTERREVREKETEIRRTRSPLKHSTESRVNARSRGEKPMRQAERASGTTTASRSTPVEPQGTICCTIAGKQQQMGLVERAGS